ncbi:unnamed protein product, partial [marine sediment metagenome]
IKRGDAIVIGHKIPKSNFKKIHMVDTKAARKWAKDNVKGIPLVFHKQ